MMKEIVSESVNSISTLLLYDPTGVLCCCLFVKEFVCMCERMCSQLFRCAMSLTGFGKSKMTDLARSHNNIIHQSTPHMLVAYSFNVYLTYAMKSNGRADV